MCQVGRRGSAEGWEDALQQAWEDTFALVSNLRSKSESRSEAEGVLGIRSFKEDSHARKVRGTSHE